jgi:hypothetical protein
MAEIRYLDRQQRIHFMKKSLVVSGNAYLSEEKSKKDIKFFTKDELNIILSLYARGVSSGDWKDYAIDALKDKTSFSIYKHASEMPVLRLTKNHKSKNIKEGWKIISMSGQELKRNKKLNALIKFLNQKKLSLVK